MHLIEKRKKRRVETQPLEYPSAGSVFRNPEYTTNYLLDTYEMPVSDCENSYDAAIDIIENFKKWVHQIGHLRFQVEL